MYIYVCVCVCVCAINWDRLHLLILVYALKLQVREIAHPVLEVDMTLQTQETVNQVLLGVRFVPSIYRYWY